MCQHCAFPQRDQSVQSGRAPSSQVETLQQRGDPSIPEQSMCTVFSSFLFFIFKFCDFSFMCVSLLRQSQNKTCHFTCFTSEASFVWWIKQETEKTSFIASPSSSFFDLFFSVDQRENSRVNWVIKYRNLSSRLNCWDTEDEFLWDEWNVLPFRAHFKQSMVKEKD